jgi:predicted nucleic acid-binding protein
MDIFVDTNIIIEIILPNRPKRDVCINALQADARFCISLLTCNIVMYFSEKYKLKTRNVLKFLDSFVILDSTLSDYSNAKKYLRNGDFEDALQVSCCVNNQIGKILTMDKGLAQAYKRVLEVELVG